MHLLTRIEPLFSLTYLYKKRKIHVRILSDRVHFHIIGLRNLVRVTSNFLFKKIENQANRMKHQYLLKIIFKPIRNNVVVRLTSVFLFKKNQNQASRMKHGYLLKVTFKAIRNNIVL